MKSNHPSRYQLMGSFNTWNSFNSPEDEREQQILEYRKRLHREKRPDTKAHQKSPHQRSQAETPQAQQLKRTFEWMAATFPETFGDNSIRRPLKLHILNDLKQFYKNAKTPQPKDLMIRTAVNRYLVMDEYLRTLHEGAPRYDLKGNVCGEVTAEEAAKAKELLQKPYKERL